MKILFHQYRDLTLNEPGVIHHVEFMTDSTFTKRLLCIVGTKKGVTTRRGTNRVSGRPFLVCSGSGNAEYLVELGTFQILRRKVYENRKRTKIMANSVYLLLGIHTNTTIKSYITIPNNERQLQPKHSSTMDVTGTREYRIQSFQLPENWR